MAVLALVAGACSRGSGQGVGSGITGRVTISGSSTVEPISVRVAELFEDVESGVAVTVDGPGTGDG
ncbi:MAG: phosphate ABC transporter substrate-binding protein, partial [Acidimicrobiia bacterium]|nr:phosphate ABC transporter substrate-binding protein [Acidimicrobiia bacterium]